MNNVGISLCGGYIPIYRMDRKIVAEIWGRRSVGGERSVANNDEDSATMAVEASANCLKGSARDEIEGLYFATITISYISFNITFGREI